jgi:hypothetical protein
MSSNILEFLNNCNDNVHVNYFPNVYTLLKIEITLSIPTATAEKSFSTLRRLKNPSQKYYGKPFKWISFDEYS